MSIESNSPAKPPRRAIILLGALALFQVIRISAYAIIQDVLAGTVAEAWMFPAMMDVFVGAVALFVALGLWRGKGLAVWTSAMVFFVLSISDHLDAVTVTLTSAGPAPAMMSGPAASVATMLLVMSAIEAFAVWTLTRKNLRSHYLP
jgi:hypothetical protein